ncbi:MAG: gliding motility-associated C-terminal domain-containing protein [Bacteroidota bacterium]
MKAVLKMSIVFVAFHLKSYSQTILTTSITALGPTTVCAPATVNLSVTTASSSATGGVWNRKTDYPNICTEPAGFSINNKGYIGGGMAMVGSALLTDFWEYDPVTDIWTQKANMPGRRAALGFNIGSKGYICFGLLNSGGTSISNQLFEYDPVSNIWTQKTPFPVNPRLKAVGFSINNKGYVGTGRDNFSVYYDDFWEYDPITDTWIQKANVPGGLREAAVGFGINNKGYIGTGWNFTQWGNTRDFWEYDPVTNLWTQKANFGGQARAGALGFSIGCKGYLGVGGAGGIFYHDFWRYDPVTNVWTQKQSFPVITQLLNQSGISFSIQDKGYFFYPFSAVSLTTMEYTPAFSSTWSTGTITPAITASVSGTYSVSINSETCFTSTASIDVVINDPVAPVTGFTYPSPLCLSGTGPLPILDPGFTSGGIFSGAGTSLDGNTGKLHLQNTGAGTYTVIYAVNASSCTLAGTSSVSVNIYQNPFLSVSTNTTIILGENASLTATSSANTYTWFPSAGLSCVNCANPLATPAETQFYCVQTTDGICTNSACVTVNVELPCSENSDFSVPNAFSPNGDGKNDIFCAQGSNRYLTYFSLSIFDRWGEKLFETSDFDSCWDGTYKGKLLNPDVFVYYIKAMCGERKEIVKKGNVTLIK